MDVLQGLTQNRNFSINLWMLLVESKFFYAVILGS